MKLTTSIVMLSAGAATSLTAVLLCFLLPFNPLFFIWNLIIPLGAIGAGFVAGSGYYFGATMTNHRPGYILLPGMLAATAASWFAGFFVAYSAMHTADMSFANWLDEYFTHVTIRRNGHSDGGAIGKFGYGLALLQIAGLLLPVYIYFMVLRGKAFCIPCQKFYKHAGRLSKRFKTIDALKSYLVALNSKQAWSYEHCDALAQSLETVKDSELTATLNYTLRQCPGCKSELLSSDAVVKQGKQWAVIKDLSKTYKVPQGSSMLNAFGKQVT